MKEQKKLKRFVRVVLDTVRERTGAKVRWWSNTTATVELGAKMWLVDLGIGEVVVSDYDPDPEDPDLLTLDEFLVAVKKAARAARAAEGT